MNIESEITEIISEIVEIEVADLDADALFMEDLGIESLRALEILAAIENKYSITIDPERLKDMTTVNNVISVTKECLATNVG